MPSNKESRFLVLLFAHPYLRAAGTKKRLLKAAPFSYLLYPAAFTSALIFCIIIWNLRPPGPCRPESHHDMPEKKYKMCSISGRHVERKYSMSKKCNHCGIDLPEDASFCPHCGQVQIEKAEVKAPRPWRKKALIAAICVILLALVVLACILYHRPKTYEGGASVTYSDKDGEYALLVSFDQGNIADQRPEAKMSLTLPYDGRSGVWAMLGVYQNGTLADIDSFFAKVESCTLEAFPNENGDVEIAGPIYNTGFLPAAREFDVSFTGASGTNEFVWTLQMKNGDTIRLKQTIEVIPLYRQAFTPEDVPLNTLEDLKALMDRINTEVPADTIVDIYLPAVTYTGNLTIVSRAVNLYGCGDGSGRTVFEGSIAVRTDSPANVTLCDLDFVGSGGTGLFAKASAEIFGCSFTGWDVGALVEDGGMIGVERCRFQDNGIGFRYNTTSYHFFNTGFPACIIKDNDIGIQFSSLPGVSPLDFSDTLFSGNGIHIDNPIGYPVDTSRSIFE